MADRRERTSLLDFIASRLNNQLENTVMKGTRNQYIALVVMLMLFVGVISLMPESPVRKSAQQPTAQQTLASPQG
jgi:hypothetical protein